MQPGPIDRARQGLALAEARIEAAAAEIARPPAASARAPAAFAPPPAALAQPPATAAAAEPADRVRLSDRAADADPIAAVLALGDGARLYRANLRVVAAADEQRAQTLDLFA